MNEKLTKYQLWLAIGGSCAGVGTLITGLIGTVAVPNENWTFALTIIGLVLSSVSIVAYQFASAYEKGQAAKANQTNLNIDIPSSKLTQDDVAALISNAASTPVVTVDEIKAEGTE